MTTGLPLERSAGKLVDEAWSKAASATGRLAFAVTKKKLLRSPLEEAAGYLEEAARLIREALRSA